MKFDEIKIGQKVTGYYFKETHTIGTVKKKLKTIIHVDFNGDLIKYDKAHIQFLKKAG